ncbi:MAG: HK97 family phage prohead protease [Rikenellaceae bacterium]
MEKKEFIAEDLKVERSDSGRMEISFYASIFGNIDSYNDVVKMGAYKDTLANDFDRMQLHYNHNGYDLPIGVISEAYEDAKGLFMRATISPTTQGKDIMILVEDGALKEFSIGYETIASHEEIVEGQQVRSLDQIKLYETSIVNRAANAEATIVSAQRKSYENLETMPDQDLLSLKNRVQKEWNTRIFKRI